MGRFDGKTALVTGASRGIGYAIAAALVDEGARVCVTARKKEPLDAAVERLGGPARAMGVAGKADDPAHHRAAVAAVIERFGTLDLLVNNAGTNPYFGSLMDAEPSVVRKTFEVNLFGTLGFTQQAYHAWMAEHGGVILNMASIAGLTNAPFMGVYNLTKAAVLHFTRQLAVELGPDVRVNALAPGVVKTDFARVLYEGREEEARAGYPLKRLGVPADVAKAALFLLSDDAAWITGETLLVDGGAVAAGSAGA